MNVQEEQERRRDLLLRVLEACADPEQALATAIRMEEFINGGLTSCEKPQEAILQKAKPQEAKPQEAKPQKEQPPQEAPRKTCNRTRWSGEDDALLRQLWQGNPAVKEVAQEIHRTPASVYARVRQLDLSSDRRDTKSGKKINGKQKIDLSLSGMRSSSADPMVFNELESVGIDSVVHFLRTRDYSVVLTENGRYKLDGHKILTAQELFDRANKVRSHIKRPIWLALENGLQGAQ